MSDHTLKAMQVDVYHDPQVGIMMRRMRINVKSTGMIIDQEMDMRKIVRAGVAAVIVQDGDIMIDIDGDVMRIKMKKRTRTRTVDLNDPVKKIKKRIVDVVDKVLANRIMKTIVKVIDEGNGMNMKRQIGIDDIIGVMMTRRRRIEEEGEEAIDIIIDAIVIDPVNVGNGEKEMMRMMRIAIVVEKDVILLLNMIAVPQDDVWIVQVAAHNTVTITAPIKVNHPIPFNKHEHLFPL